LAQPLVTVVVATRDRPDLFRGAINSILGQTETAFALVVVEDGSDATHRAGYEQVLADLRARLGDRLTVRSLAPRRQGHGRSYATNVGACLATTPYLAFLDDDDAWIDPAHLARVRRMIDAAAPDMIMANQRAWFRGEPVDRDIWLSGLEAQLRSRGRDPDEQGAFAVAAEDLADAGGFCHLNCLVVSRALFDAVGGMDEGLRWEDDRDLLLRLSDQAERMLHHPAVVSRHNIPDPDARANMTTAVSMLDKRLYQLRLLDKAALFARHPAIRAHGRLHKGYVLKQVAEELAAARRWRDARWFAGQALGAAPTWKWTAYALYCAVRAAFSGPARPPSGAAAGGSDAR